MSALTITRHDAHLPEGDILVEDLWVSACNGGTEIGGIAAGTFADALAEAREWFSEYGATSAEVYAVCWPSMQSVRVATVEVEA